MLDYYVSTWKNSFRLSGRSRRKEYWTFALFNFLIGVVFGIGQAFSGTNMIVAGISLCFQIAVLFPNFSLSVRRLHDIDLSGWWLLTPMVIVALGFVGFFWGVAANQGSEPPLWAIIMMTVAVAYSIGFALYMGFKGSVPANKWGHNPKESIADKA
jgi:uncharacterized membrane protein YhaH (DUF805 family)